MREVYFGVGGEPIEPIAFCLAIQTGTPLPDDHAAKRFAARLFDRHPVRRLFNGGMQQLGREKHVLGCLRLFSEVYAEHLARALRTGLLRTSSPIGTAAMAGEIEAFERLFPDDVLFWGGRYRLRVLRKNARDAIERLVPDVHLRLDVLLAFDCVFAQLVRAVRLSESPDPAARIELRVVPST